jgi:biofilm PGA synthesis N-glycosyltransferase PgaC
MVGMKDLEPHYCRISANIKIFVRIINLTELNIADYPLACRVMAGVLAGSFLLQMVYWWAVHARLVYYRPAGSGIRKFPVSVIICARNEEENLRANLPLVLGQDYPDFEVIVVDDASTDGTADLLRDFRQQYPQLRTSSIKPNVHISKGKKLALTVGIKAARHEWILLTDADCRPAGPQWLSLMQRNFSRDTGIVLGYGGYSRRRGLLNLVIRYDAFFVALQYFGFALAGLPYMGVGRNLAYRREIFFRHKGFASHYELASGDDDLFINEVARREPTRIEIRPGAHTYSDPKRSWRDWYYQKRRHLTTGPRYRPATKFLLGTEIISRLLFYASFAYLLAFQVMLPTIIVIFLVRLLSTMLVIKWSMSRLNESYLLLISPLMDLVLPLVQIGMAFSNYVASKRARWS